ncbi:hypothetical protein HanPSC8_Chr12g0531411 [Helianthus annuus]|nr:hypothetical protein HanPSC8_Chr12g0531411 [Helianthus annuus]
MVLCRPPLPAASLADARRWSCARRIPTCKHPLTSCLHQKSTLQPLPLSIPPPPLDFTSGGPTGQPSAVVWAFQISPISVIHRSDLIVSPLGSSFFRQPVAILFRSAIEGLTSWWWQSIFLSLLFFRWSLEGV